MSAPMLPAQMSNSGGRWHLYVPLTGEQWPAHYWSSTAPVPTLAERARALALGFAVAGEWTWIEDSEVYGDPATAVLSSPPSPSGPQVSAVRRSGAGVVMVQRFEAWMAEGLAGWTVSVVMFGHLEGVGPSHPVNPPGPWGVPTEAERAAALDVLGYVAEDDARWSSRMPGRHRVWSAPIRPLGSYSTVVAEGQMAFWGEGR